MQIREGLVPNLTLWSNQESAIESDTIFISATGEKEIKETIKNLLSNYLPSRGFHMQDIQILSPMNKYDLGNDALNLLVQEF